MMVMIANARMMMMMMIVAMRLASVPMPRRDGDGRCCGAPTAASCPMIRSRYRHSRQFMLTSPAAMPSIRSTNVSRTRGWSFRDSRPDELDPGMPRGDLVRLGIDAADQDAGEQEVREHHDAAKAQPGGALEQRVDARMGPPL